MTEYVLRLRMVTDAQPRDSINWDAIALVAGGLFKSRPVLPIALLSAVVEQVEPATVRGSTRSPTRHGSPADETDPPGPSDEPSSTPADQAAPSQPWMDEEQT